jgi:uncharacterized membrane protein
MRKILATLAFLALISAASATTITNEDVTIDLSDNHVHADVTVGKLTSTDFTYISTVHIDSLNASISGEPIRCEVSDLTLGSEIQCATEERENFTVTLDYHGSNLVSKEEDVSVFRYRYPFYRPTEQYSLEVVLPRGAALVDQENTSQQVISPGNYETGSNGRRIFVKWDTQPRLGETTSFFVLYEDLADQPDGQGESFGYLFETIAVVVVILFLAALIVRRKRRDLSEEYENLSDDQKEVLDLLEDNEGEYLQKDLVQELDYSKAKVSGIVSELVEKGIIKKTKEGRSNKLSISRKYRY